MILAPTWKLFFASRESNDAGNKNPAAYLSAWSDEVSPEAKLSLLSNDPNTVVLAGDNNNSIMILHSFKNLGGTILSPADKLVCLIGLNRIAPPLIVNEVAISENCNITTPSADAIIACNDLEELLNLNPPPAPANDPNDAETADDDTETKYSGGNTFLPPPWVLHSVIEAQTDDPLKLILAVNEGATRFNDEQLAKDATYVPNTLDTVKSFVKWAWGVKNNLIPPTTFFIDPNDMEADSYFNLRHQTCIQPIPPLHGATGTAPPPPGPPPSFTLPTNPTGATNTMNANEAILQQLTVSLTRQSEIGETHNELFARQLEHNLEKEDKKKDRIKKFHTSIKQLILFASATDAEVVPDDILESCKRVFNAETVVNAEQELNLQFSNMGMRDASFAPGFVASLYSGKFLWTKNFTPNNFSPFMICEAEPLTAPENQPRRLVLHLEDTNGKSSNDITAGGKNTVKAPTTYDAMFQRLKYFRGACQIFFGKTSIPYISLNALTELCELNKHTFKTQEIELEFTSKFLLAIDKRFQIWLDNCMTATDRTRVDDGILNFHPLIDTVRFGTFDLRLPLTFKESKPENTNTKNKKAGGGGSGGGDDDADNGAKGKKRRKSEQSERITNEHQPEHFKMKDGETWPTHFANKNVNSRVPWKDDGDAKMCPRWFIGGYCFKNCFHKISHVKADEIPSDKMTAFKTFLNQIRGETSN